MSERILVTGGCGFVGSRLVRRLVDQGSDVVVVDDFSLGVPENLGPALGHAQIVGMDIRDGDPLRDAFAALRPQIVIHLAALHFIPACNADPKRCLDINVGGTQAVLDASAAASVDTVVLASTAAVYAPADDPHAEEATIGPDDVYGISKLVTEQIGELFHRRTAISVGAARLFNVFGPGETNPHLIPVILRQAQAGASMRLGNLDTKRDYVFVDDVGAALAAMPAAVREHGWVVCNVGRGEELDGDEIVREVGQLVGHDLDVTTDPARVRKSDRPHLLSDSSKAARLLGWSAGTSLRDGLRAALDEPVAAGLEIS